MRRSFLGAAVLGEAALGVLVEGLAVLQLAVAREDHVRGARGELTARIRIPGLEEYRVNLGAAGRIETTGDVEEFAVVVVSTRGLVRVQRADGPGLPQLPGGVNETLGALVALGVGEVATAADSSRLT